MGLIAGVDEAGRGSVIGPLVVAGVLIEEGRAEELRLMGARDSKTLRPERRSALAVEITAAASGCAYFELPPSAIDIAVDRNPPLRKLNYLEAVAMAKVIRDLDPDVVYVDAPDVNPERFAVQLLRAVPTRPEVVCEHKADERYPVVSAASILAKVRRDAIVAALRREHGDFGSGYPSDAKTVAFLEAWLRSGRRPPFVRYSWMTVKRLLGAAAS